jgi:hypothetical protein
MLKPKFDQFFPLAPVGLASIYKSHLGIFPISGKINQYLSMILEFHGTPATGHQD